MTVPDGSPVPEMLRDRTVAIVGDGRLGRALAHALRAASIPVSGPHGRGFDGAGADVVLLCVPDGQLRAAAAVPQDGPFVGHCSGATGLDALAGVPESKRFSMHPLVTATMAGATFAGAAAATAGSSPAARGIAEALATSLGMRTFAVRDDDRAAYHAGAAMAANFLVTVQWAAARLLQSVDVPPDVVLPLARQALANWAAAGPAALTGPIARGDAATVAAHRRAVATHTPDLLALFDELASATRQLAAAPSKGSPMIVSRTVADLRAQVSALRQQGKTVGLVPTMGALHAGHLELIRRARTECDAVVLTIFVNPAQFDDKADLAAYPRNEQVDLELAEAAGVNLAFLPPVSEVYPAGFTASVQLHGPLVETLEGAERGASHFAGVTTVVSKLFHMVGADRAYFGQKDAQQLRVIQAMVADLNLDVDVVAVPTVREDDGMALSSRNVRLGAAERDRATALSRALFAADADFGDGERNVGQLLAAANAVLAEVGITPDYLAVVDERSFQPVAVIDRTALLLVAARVGQVRLIDNVVLRAS